MRYLIALRLIAAAVAISPATANATPVTWSFHETACTDLGIGGGNCTPPQPFVLAALVLPGPTSAGSAFWQGSPSVAPVYTGDSFAFMVFSPLAIQTLTPAFTGSNQCNGQPTICDFDLSWSEIAGQLVAVSINFDAFHDDIGGLAGGSFGLTGGRIATDTLLGGCIASQCLVAGFWQSDLPMPEPASALLLAAGLFTAWLGRRRRR